MRTPRSLALLSAAVAAGVALTLGAAAPASAGGPTSVLVVDYEGSRAGAALTGSATYADLERALTPAEPPYGQRLGAASFMGVRLRLTWLIHDVTPWRIDAVTIEGGQVWVETVMSLDGGTDLFSAPAVRHRPTDAALLLRALRTLGVLDGARPVVPGSVPAQEAGSTTAASGSREPVEPASPGPPWPVTAGVAGLALVVGVVTGLTAGPRGRRPSPSGRT